MKVEIRRYYRNTDTREARRKPLSSVSQCANAYAIVCVGGENGTFYLEGFVACSLRKVF